MSEIHFIGSSGYHHEEENSLQLDLRRKFDITKKSVHSQIQVLRNCYLRINQEVGVKNIDNEGVYLRVSNRCSNLSWVITVLYVGVPISVATSGSASAPTPGLILTP